MRNTVPNNKTYFEEIRVCNCNNYDFFFQSTKISNVDKLAVPTNNLLNLRIAFKVYQIVIITGTEAKVLFV